MEWLLIQVVVALVMAAVIWPITRYRHADWYRIPRSDRRAIVRAVQQGKAVPDEKLIPLVQRRADQVVAFYSSRGTMVIILGIGLFGIGRGEQAISSHNWPSLTVPIFMLGYVAWFFYSRRRYLENAVRARAVNT